jgi:hypothetical protein
MLSVSREAQCLATGRTTWLSRFDPRQRQNDFFCIICVQTGSGPPSLLYNGNRWSFLQSKSAAGS